MSNQLRRAQQLLRSDLDNLTIAPRPWAQTGRPKATLKLSKVWGGMRPTLPVRIATWVMLTTSSHLPSVDPNRPFQGRVPDASGNAVVAQSTQAEVIWWTRWDDRDGDGAVDFDEPVTVYRRELLVLPGFDLSGATVGADFYAEFDISARIEGGALVANSIEDLAHRAVRHARAAGSTFPHNIDRTLLDTYRRSAGAPLQTTGDDIVLTNVCGFDIKVYSPSAGVKLVQDDGSFAMSMDNKPTIAVEPGDAGYVATATPAAAHGAFVDLNHGSGGWFSGAPEFKAARSTGLVFYDTWTPIYEVDGIDQDGLYGIDQATNREDDDAGNGVDDNGERETLPPYAQPIRGIQISIRLVEKTTNQIRQATVIHSFVPE